MDIQMQAFSYSNYNYIVNKTNKILIFTIILFLNDNAFFPFQSGYYDCVFFILHMQQYWHMRKTQVTAYLISLK